MKKVCRILLLVFSVLFSSLTISSSVHGEEKVNSSIDYVDKQELVIGKKQSFSYKFKCTEEPYEDENGVVYPPVEVCEIKDVISNKIYVKEDTTYAFDLKQKSINNGPIMVNLKYRLVVGKSVDTKTKKIKDIEYVITESGTIRKTYVGSEGTIHTVWEEDEEIKYNTFTIPKGTHYISLEFFSNQPMHSGVSGTYSILPISLDDDYLEIFRPSKPVLSKKKSTYSSVTLGWEKMNGIYKYQIYYSTKKDSGYQRYGTYDKNVTSAIVKGLKTGKTYYFKVRGLIRVEDKSVYTKYSNIINAKVKLNAPKNLSVTKDTYRSLKITWNSVAGATNYELYRKVSEDGKWTKNKTFSKDITETKVEKLKTGLKYYYKVRAIRNVKGDNVYSLYSNIDYAIPSLKKTTITVTKKSSSSVKVAWKAVSGATGYQIYQATGSQSYKKIKTVSSKYNYQTVGSLKKGKTYGFKVRAYRVVDGKNVYASFSSIVKMKM